MKFKRINYHPNIIKDLRRFIDSKLKNGSERSIKDMTSEYCCYAQTNLIEMLLVVQEQYSINLKEDIEELLKFYNYEALDE